MTNAEKFIEVFGTELPKRQYITKSWWEQEFIPPTQNNFELSLNVLGVNNGKILLESQNGRLMHLSGINIEKTNEKLIKNGIKPMPNVVVQEREESDANSD